MASHRIVVTERGVNKYGTTRLFSDEVQNTDHSLEELRELEEALDDFEELTDLHIEQTYSIRMSGELRQVVATVYFNPAHVMNVAIEHFPDEEFPEVEQPAAPEAEPDFRDV